MPVREGGTGQATHHQPPTQAVPTGRCQHWCCCVGFGLHLSKMIHCTHVAAFYPSKWYPTPDIQHSNMQDRPFVSHQMASNPIQYHTVTQHPRIVAKRCPPSVTNIRCDPTQRQALIRQYFWKPWGCSLRFSKNAKCIAYIGKVRFDSCIPQKQIMNTATDEDRSVVSQRWTVCAFCYAAESCASIWPTILNHVRCHLRIVPSQCSTTCQRCPQKLQTWFPNFATGRTCSPNHLAPPFKRPSFVTPLA